MTALSKFFDAASRVWRVVNHALTVHVVERLVFVRQRLGVALANFGSESVKRETSLRQLDSALREIARTDRNAAPREQKRPEPDPAACIEHAATRSEIAEECGLGLAGVLGQRHRLVVCKELGRPGFVAGLAGIEWVRLPERAHVVDRRLLRLHRTTPPPAAARLRRRSSIISFQRLPSTFQYRVCFTISSRQPSVVRLATTLLCPGLRS